MCRYCVLFVAVHVLCISCFSLAVSCPCVCVVLVTVVMRVVVDVCVIVALVVIVVAGCILATVCVRINFNVFRSVCFSWYVS